MSNGGDHTDEELLARCAGSDPSGFGDIVRNHQAMVYSLALHFLRNPTEAEDTGLGDIPGAFP